MKTRPGPQAIAAESDAARELLRNRVPQPRLVGLVLEFGAELRLLRTSPAASNRRPRSRTATRGVHWRKPVDVEAPVYDAVRLWNACVLAHRTESASRTLVWEARTEVSDLTASAGLPRGPPRCRSGVGLSSHKAVVVEPRRPSRGPAPGWWGPSPPRVYEILRILHKIRPGRAIRSFPRWRKR